MGKKVDIQPTSLEVLKEYANGEIVEFPPFAKNQPFAARIKRPSIVALMKKGKIPNHLMQSATMLFNGTKTKQDELKNENLLPEMLEVIEVLADSAFIEPTWQQLQEAGIELTADQMMFIFEYTQGGVKALKPFRGESADTASNNNVKNV